VPCEEFYLGAEREFKEDMKGIDRDADEIDSPRERCSVSSAR